MSKSFHKLALFLLLVLACRTLSAQSDDEGGVASALPRNDGASSRNDEVAGYEELASKIEQLQNRMNSLSATTERYASENQRLKDENTRLQRELYLIGQELNEARSLADDTSRRFDSSVAEVDQNSWILSDYQRRVEEFCADAWGSADDMDQCSRQLRNFENLDNRIKSK